MNQVNKTSNSSEDIRDRYNMEKVIGKGAFGTVYLATQKST